MHSNDDNVYDLVTKLCECLLTRNNIENDSHSAKTLDHKDVKHFRAKAFELLLKKSSLTIDDKEYDPIPELIKHAYALRVVNGNFSQAKELEEHLTELINGTPESDLTISSTLVFLNELKSHEKNAKQSLDIFHFGKPNPFLPEVDRSNNAFLGIQMYPLESFQISSHFELALGREKNSNTNIINKSPIISRFIFHNSMLRNLEHCQSKDGKLDSVSSMIPTISSSYNLISEYSPGSYFLPNLQKNNEQYWKEGIVTEPEYSCQQFLGTPNTDVESYFGTSQPPTPNENVEKEVANNSAFFCDEILKNPEFFNHRTWENLGNSRLKKEPPFITDFPNAAVYLERLKNSEFLPLLSKKEIVNFSEMATEVEAHEFLKNAKLLLLGIESEFFVCGSNDLFRLKKKLIIPGISSKALENVCFQLVQWANCYKSLFLLISPNPLSQELQVKGLIFKALCNSISKFLLFWKAAVQCVKVEKNSMGLLRFLDNVRDLGNYITEITQLCKCNQQRMTVLGEGIGILTHIYDRATKVTKPEVALIFYSILQSCCQVYFRLLQQWIFEGVCGDIYDEFMIQVRSKYARSRAHRFWTRAFSINKKSVPGFLSELAPLILECGKSMTLLKICDSKNKICHLSSSQRPPISVCLSEEMQNEQIKYYEEYMKKGQVALGQIVTFSSAIQKKKNEEKQRGELVIKAQQETLLRLQMEQEEALRKRAEEKSALFATLKTQAEESILRKERENQAGLEADRLFMENLIREEEEKAKKIEGLEKMKTLEHYNELALQAEHVRSRADWKMRRLQLFDERILVLAEMENSFLQKEDKAKSELMPENKMEIKIVVGTSEIGQAQDTDENSNLTEQISTVDENEMNEEIVRPVRPMFLDFAGPKKIDVGAAAEKNKDRVLQETYVNLANNNNENNTYSASFHSPDLQYKEIQANRLRNTRHQMDSEWDISVSRKSMFSSVEAQKNKRKMMSTRGENYAALKNLKNEEISGLVVDVSEKSYDLAEDEKNKKKTSTETENLKNEEIPDPSVVDAHEKLTDQETTAAPKDLTTPMSCTTDYFTYSMNSSCTHIPSGENTPYYEVDSETNYDLPTFQDRNENKFFQLAEVPNFMGPGQNLGNPVFGHTLTTGDVDMINSTSLRDHLIKSVMIPLQTQSQLVNNAIIKYFLQEQNLLSHLHSLRSYFFLLNGEFAKTLSQSLFTRLYQVSTPMEFFNPAALKQILTKAIRCSFSNNCDNDRLLNLYAVNVPEKLQVSNPEALGHLSLNYKTCWPLNIIFDDSVMEQYNKVFKFLLMVGRVIWVLQEDFHILKEEGKNTISDQLHKVQLYRHSMMQFVNALHTYLTCSVLHASWAEFEKELENVTTLDTFSTTHVFYMKKILSKCMLTQRGEIMRKCICTMFNMILKFHNHVRSQRWVSRADELVHPNYKRLEEIYHSFCQQRQYLAHVAEKLTTSGYQPHFSHFLHVLNINHSFKVTK